MGCTVAAVGYLPVAGCPGAVPDRLICLKSDGDDGPRPRNGGTLSIFTPASSAVSMAFT